MADIFTKQECREGIPNILIKASDVQIRKRWSRNARDVLFSYRQLISNCWYLSI